MRVGLLFNSDWRRYGAARNNISSTQTVHANHLSLPIEHHHLSPIFMLQNYII